MNDQNLESHGVKVSETMTTPSKPGKKPRPVWVVFGNVFGLETFFRDIGGKKYRGNWSFFTNPSDAILEELTSHGRQSFSEHVESTLERKEARIERFEGYSENAEARSSAAYNRAHEISSMIPMGQPVLIGHHSEKRHRRALKRIDSGMQKSIEESKKSDYYDSKASSLGYEVTRARESREYMGNRVDEATKELAALQRSWKLNPGRIELTMRISNTQKKLSYWEKRLKERETEILAEGGQVATPENIKIGDEIYYTGWLPVIRVNQKTVTVSHWLGVPTFTYKIEYRRITKFRTPGKV